jgi:TPR repeat protein
LRKVADAGNPDGMYRLGWVYRTSNNWAVTQDYLKARWWFHKAAEAGNESAMFRLGEMYEVGLSVAQDYTQGR